MTTTPARPMTLDELAAFSEELAGLVRAGVSLEHGLVDLGDDLPGRVGRLSIQLGKQMGRGESLERAITTATPPFPAVWRAAVTAGVRSGRLATVLESLAETGRNLADARRALACSLIYPAIVALVGYGVFVFITAHVAPILADAFHSIVRVDGGLTEWLSWLGDRVWYWVAWPPVVLALWLVIEVIMARRASSSGGPVAALLGRIWPSLIRAQRDARLANFLDILALLVREQQPLHEAVMLAANATNDRSIQEAAREFADRLAGGAAAPHSANSLPPLVQSLLGRGAVSKSPNSLADALANAARSYRDRSDDASQRQAVAIPIGVTAGVGGIIVLAIGLSVFWPLRELLLRISM